MLTLLFLLPRKMLRPLSNNKKWAPISPVNKYSSQRKKNTSASARAIIFPRKQLRKNEKFRVVWKRINSKNCESIMFGKIHQHKRKTTLFANVLRTIWWSAMEKSTAGAWTFQHVMVGVQIIARGPSIQRANVPSAFSSAFYDLAFIVGGERTGGGAILTFWVPRKGWRWPPQPPRADTLISSNTSHAGWHFDDEHRHFASYAEPTTRTNFAPSPVFFFGCGE